MDNDKRPEFHNVVDKLNLRIKQATRPNERLLEFPYPSSFEDDDAGDSKLYPASNRDYEGLDDKKKSYLGEILDHTPGMWFNKRTVRTYATVCRCTTCELGTWMYSRRFRKKSILKGSKVGGGSGRPRPGDKKLNWLDELFTESELDFLEENFQMERPWTTVMIEKMAWRLEKSQKQIECWETKRRATGNTHQEKNEAETFMKILRNHFARWPKLRQGEAEVLARLTGDSPAKIETIFLSMYYTRKFACDDYMRLHKPPINLMDDPEYRYLFPKATSYTSSECESVVACDDIWVSTTVNKSSAQPKSISISTTIRRKSRPSLPTTSDNVISGFSEKGASGRRKSGGQSDNINASLTEKGTVGKSKSNLTQSDDEDRESLDQLGETLVLPSKKESPTSTRKTKDVKKSKSYERSSSMRRQSALDFDQLKRYQCSVQHDTDIPAFNVTTMDRDLS